MRCHGWVKHIVHDFEYSAKVQFKFHLVMMVFWTLNAIVALSVFIFFPHLWIRASILYVLLISLYANWDTDYDAMSASLAALHGEELLAQGKTVAVEGRVIAAEVKKEKGGSSASETD